VYTMPSEVWRSREAIAQVYEMGDGVVVIEV